MVLNSYLLRRPNHFDIAKNEGDAIRDDSVNKSLNLSNMSKNHDDSSSLANAFNDAFIDSDDSDCLSESKDNFFDIRINTNQSMEKESSQFEEVISGVEI